MKTTEFEYLDLRPATDAHRTNIPDGRSRDLHKYDRIVSAVFAQQQSIFSNPAEPESVETKLSRYFYDTCYISPVLTRNSPRGAAVSSDDFIRDVILQKTTESRNRFFYLLGDVGVGKSAYVYWLITTQLQSHVESGRIWFVVLDFEDYINHPWPVPIPTLLRDLISRIQSITRRYSKYFQNCAQELLALEKEAANPRPANVCSLIAALGQKTGRSLFLVLDNIDFICHLRDQSLFAAPGDTGEANILLAIYDFLCCFRHQGDLGHMNANILVVTRSDSYSVLKETAKISRSRTILTDQAPAFFVQPPTVRQALEARCNLLEYAGNISDIPEGTKKRYVQIPLSIQEDILTDKPALSDQLYTIHNNSLREIMQFFTHYGWLSDLSLTPGGHRLIKSHRLGLMVAILNHKARFSESLSHFPNIYLVNPLPAEGSHRQEEVGFQHCYWLRRLILHYLYENESMREDQILHIFCSGKSAYDEKLVRACMGSLSSIAGPACVGIRRGAHPIQLPKRIAIEKIYLTPRGKFLIDHVVDKFFYLQLAVEEPALPIPLCVRKQFDFKRLDENGVDYTYLTKTSPEYEKKGSRMIAIKAEQVLLLLEVLGAAYSAERVHFSDVFRRLGERNVRMPDIEAIKAGVLAELGVVSGFFGGAWDLGAIQKATAARRKDIEGHISALYTTRS